jgi:hypothetical protein
MERCTEPKITGIFLVNSKDLVYDNNGNIVRMKRKYGKYTRPVYRVK